MIYIPYVDATETVSLQSAILHQYGLEFLHYRIDRDDQDGYRKFMAQRWERGETFVIIEHDILPWPGAVQELLACECVWGTYSYYTNGGIGVSHMLGCTKITNRLIAALPNIWKEPRVWYELDSHLMFTAREIGIEPHLHRPAVIHLNKRELIQ